MTPSKELVCKLFKSYVKQWRSYSEHYLLYYLYQRQQVKSSFTLSDLLQVAVPELLQKAHQLEQEAPTIYVPENDSNQTLQSPHPEEISPQTNKQTKYDQYSPEILKQQTKRSNQNV